MQGTALLALGLWLAPRVMREHEMLPADAELAARAQQLTQRVQTLTRTRTEAVDTAVAELRRIERDLHDGAQARLVAVGMSLQAAERPAVSSTTGPGCCGRRSPTTARAGPTPRPAPGWPESSAGSRRLMASWR